jgi:hypothetical protein
MRMILLIHFLCFCVLFTHVYCPTFNGNERFRVTLKLQEKQYELQILNTTEEDLGLYLCQAELNSITTETKVILRLAGNTII